MGEFVGKRVVPDHVGIWDQNKTYEPLMIVLDKATGDSYISRRAVPSGISLADESYWSLCSHYSAQMRKLEQDVSLDVQQMHSDVTAAKGAMSKELADTHTAMSQELSDTHTAMSQELEQTEQRVGDNLKQTSSELSSKVEQAKSDLNIGRQELQDAKTTLNKRMDSIAGGRTTDQEILDARVGADGKTYDNIGAHLRKVGEDVLDLLEEEGFQRAKQTTLSGNEIVENFPSGKGYSTTALYGSHIGIPVLSLTGDMTGISKQNKVSLAWKFGNLSGSCSLKWQGASSIAYDKKNFTITFDEKQAIVSAWGAQKKYCLKANYVDFSHCRNIVAAKLWGQTVKSRSTRNDKLYPLPNGGAIDGFPIMVVINDKYQGVYTFNIPKDKWMLGMGTGEKECILTAETHSKPTQFAALAKVDASDFEIEYIPDETNTQWAKDSVNKLIQAVMDFKGTTAAEVENALGAYVDLDGAIDYFIFTCMLALTDNLDKN